MCVVFLFIPDQTDDARFVSRHRAHRFEPVSTQLHLDTVPVAPDVTPVTDSRMRMKV